MLAKTNKPANGVNGQSTGDKMIEEKTAHPEYAPKHTLHIHNLNEKIRTDDLRQTLFVIFSKFGKVLNVTAKKNIRMRGQAFVTFEKIEEAVAAKEKLSKAFLFKKEMFINFAKEDSDTVYKHEGTYVFKGKRPGYKCVPLKSGAKDSKKNQLREKQEQENLIPNKVLYVEDLPQTSTEALIALFQEHPGFREVRYVAPKACAFVEFEDEFQAGIALNYLNGFKLTPEKAMKIRYANK